MMPIVVCSSLLTALGLFEASQIGVVEHLGAGEGPVEVGPVPEDFAAVE